MSIITKIPLTLNSFSINMLIDLIKKKDGS